MFWIVPIIFVFYIHKLINRDLSHNRITNLPNYAFQHQTHLHDLLLADNQIKIVSEFAFLGLRKLKTL